MAFLTWLFSAAWSTVTAPFLSMWTSYLSYKTSAGQQAVDTLAQADTTQQVVTVAAYSHWWSTLPLVAAATPMILYQWKCIVWDTMLGLGSTPSLHGQVSDLGTVSFECLTGYGGALGISGVFGAALALFGRK
jgi:hypothetical protein